MLIITRRLSEAVLINEAIKITVLEIKRRQVKLAIQAPKHLPIYREEVYLARQREKTKLMEIKGAKPMASSHDTSCL